LEFAASFDVFRVELPASSLVKQRMLDAVRGVLLSGRCRVGVNPIEVKVRSLVEDAQDGEFPCVQTKVLSASSDISLDEPK
jgi:hypothetical protein